MCLVTFKGSRLVYIKGEWVTALNIVHLHCALRKSLLIKILPQFIPWYQAVPLTNSSRFWKVPQKFHNFLFIDEWNFFYSWVILSIRQEVEHVLSYFFKILRKCWNELLDSNKWFVSIFKINIFIATIVKFEVLRLSILILIGQP